MQTQLPHGLKDFAIQPQLCARVDFSACLGQCIGYIAKWPTKKSMPLGEELTVDRQTLARYEARAHVIKALAHPTRLFIVDELTRGERCVCELRDLVGADLSTVSKHLALLKGAGILTDSKRGAQVFYRLRVPCVLNFFGCVEAVLQATAAQAAEVTR